MIDHSQGAEGERVHDEGVSGHKFGVEVNRVSVITYARLGVGNRKTPGFLVASKVLQ